MIARIDMGETYKRLKDKIAVISGNLSCGRTSQVG